MRPRPLRIAALNAALALALSACGGGAAPNAPDSPAVEAQAKVAYDGARASDDPQALLDVHQRFPKAPSGKKALFLAVDRLSTEAEKLAKGCKDDEARKILTTIAGYVTDEPSVDEKVDALKEKVEKNRRRCRMATLDEAIEAAVKAWDWPKVFTLVDDEQLPKDLDAKTVERKRAELKKQWLRAIDKTVSEIVKRRSAGLVIDDYRQAWLAAIDPKGYPEDLRD